jgi:Sec-independent protein translocase protein TatA
MDILGIGPLELLLILLIALIFLGPNDMVKAGKTLGKLMRKVVTHPSWKTIQNTSSQIRTLPNKMIREAGLEDLDQQFPNTADLKKQLQLDDTDDNDRENGQDLSEWLSPTQTIAHPTMTASSSDVAETLDKDTVEDHPPQSSDPNTD